MMTSVERRHEARGRIPFALAVELAHHDFDDSFEADAVDLCAGGLSLRTACLPDVGEELVCRFEAVPGGSMVSSRGRVVWTQLEGERSGEFGLRFTDLDGEARALIDELVAERKAQAGMRADAGPRLAQLELAGVGAPLAARLLRSGGGEAVFEQSLDLLELGRGVVARAGGALGRGSIAEVQLHMEGGVPTLAVTVRFDEGRSLFGEFEWESKPETQSDTDTTPDLDAPQQERSAPQLVSAQQNAAEPSASVTMTEFEVAKEPRQSEALATESSAGEVPAALRAETELAIWQDEVESSDADEEHDDEDELEDEDADAEDESLDDDDNDDAVIASSTSDAPRIVVAPELSAARVAVLPAPKPVSASAPAAEIDETWAHPVPESARSSALVRLLRVLLAIGAALRSASAFAGKTLGPAVQTLGAQTSNVIKKRLMPFARHQAHGLVDKLNARPMRTTTAPGASHKRELADSNTLRTAGIALLAMSAIALGVYALAPAADDGAIPLHRKVKRSHASQAAQPAATGTESAAAAVPAIDPSAAAAPGASGAALPVSTVNAAYASAMAGRPLVAQPSAAGSTQAAPAVPAARSVPTSSPYAVDVRSAAPKPAAAKSVGPALSFGQKSVANAQRFVLRMSAPVKTLQGTGDKTGFTVVAGGALSLDKAGPIAASHKSVARAMVLNRNGQAELSVRFNDGKSPAYRISSHGAELEILIAN